METKNKAKKVAVVTKRRCAACGACENACPRSAIAVWKGCYAVPDASICIGCGICSRTCPAGCIEIVRRDGE